MENDSKLMSELMYVIERFDEARLRNCASVGFTMGKGVTYESETQVLCITYSHAEDPPYFLKEYMTYDEVFSMFLSEVHKRNLENEFNALYEKRFQSHCAAA